MFYQNKIWMAKNKQPINMLPQMANRHGLITGATGTGKTITLKVMAESFSDMGVPVFVSDIKGDLSGMCEPGADSENMRERIARFGLDQAGFTYRSYPTRFWDVFGAKGSPVRATISEMGPLLLSHIMGLTDVQQGVLNIVFCLADDKGMLLLDIKDLRAMLQYTSDHASEIKTTYGNVSAQSIGAIQRGLLELEQQGAESFFGEPALEIGDWIGCDAENRGYINVMNCEKLFLQPKLYASFLLWMLSELYEALPEAGDLDKPKLVFFFDEAHLLFHDAPKNLIMKIEQIVRLIRSKAVGVYFITQSPSDIPDTVLSQLGNRVQHALRAYTPSDQKTVKAAADTFRPNPAFDTMKVITELGTGEALVSFLDETGVPGVVERAFILPPQSRMGPAEESVMRSLIDSGPMAEKYNTPVDRESAYEMLVQKTEAAQTGIGQTQDQQADIDRAEKTEREIKQEAVKEAKAELKRESAQKKRDREITKVASSAINTIGRQATRSLVRGLFDILKK